MTAVPPLADVRILAVEQFGAGPWATMQLADLGADVIKIEDPGSGGDVGRYVPPQQAGEDSVYFESFNRNKRSVSLDLRSPDGRAVFLDLVAHSDAVLSNLKGGQAEKLGLMYAQLREHNPRIVCCSLTGFGATGPRAGEGGYDYVAQGMAGWMHITGDPDGPPTKSGLSLVDLSAGYVSSIAILSGIHRARRDGTGCDCDISLFDTALSELGYVGYWAASRRLRRAPDEGLRAPVARALPGLRDGGRLDHGRLRQGEVLAARSARRRGGRSSPPTRATPPSRTATATATSCSRCSARCSAGVRRSEWLRVLGAAGVPVGPVNDLPAAFADPQSVARGAIVEVEHPRLGTVRHIASPLRLDAEAPPIRSAPARGEHTREVLRDVCGYSDERLEELRRSGAV